MQKKILQVILFITSLIFLSCTNTPSPEKESKSTPQVSPTSINKQGEESLAQKEEQAANSQIPEKLDQLASDSEWTVRANVAANPSTASETLTKFLQDIPEVQVNVAANPNTSKEVLEIMQKHPNPQISKRAKANLLSEP